uniref:Uncharacterized protein n=1 Tax=Neogobius melanostomus TaxID=47308 RepID=A0A8C6UQZ3_9GOBI
MPNTEPWVGTWRPHRPRGPINAMYGSPGPKYALPGLTGEKQHSLSKVKAPSYSFGIRHVPPPSNQSPGPQYMVPSNVTRVGRVGTPAFSLYGRHKDPSVFHFTTTKHPFVTFTLYFSDFLSSPLLVLPIPLHTFT